MTVACKSRHCPQCGKVWVQRNVVWYQYVIGKQTDLHSLRVSEADWSAFYMRAYRTKALYLAVMDRPGSFIVYLTSPIQGSHPVKARAECRQLGRLFQAARRMDKRYTRPVRASHAWSMPPEEDHSEYDQGNWKTVSVSRVPMEKMRQALIEGGVKPKTICDADGNEILTWTYPEGTDPNAFEWMMKALENGALDDGPNSGRADS